MESLGSYVCGGWRIPESPGRAIHDAATGAEIARISQDSIDLAAVLHHGRRVGGSALRELTFHERARSLKNLAAALRGHLEELRQLAARSGATRADADHDIGGGLNALRRYGAIGLTDLPDDRILIVEDERPASRGGRTDRQTAVARDGVSLQINAYGLPLHGALEKFAAAFLAGMPSVVRPAGRTAYLVVRLVERMIESGTLPEGALQLVVGARDLVDHTTAGDVISFSGTWAIAQRLRARVLDAGVDVHLLTESLNRAVLAPDAVPGTAAFNAFVEHLVTTMTRYAGQTPSATRTAFVPAGLLGKVTAEVSARLAGTMVGHPDDPAVEMGPLVDPVQGEKVRGALAELTRLGRVVAGSPDRIRVTGADDGRGAFMSPVLLEVDDPCHRELRRVEAFGPVSALVPYSSPDDLADAMAHGPRVREGTLITGDPGGATSIARRIAPWHARLRILDGENGFGMVSLVDDGDAERRHAISRHLRRTTVESTSHAVSAVTGRWLPGADRTVPGKHPLRMYLDELKPGYSVTVGPRKITRADIKQFAALTGDRYYLHTDDAAARDNPIYGGIVAHGYLVMSCAAGLFVTPEPGPVLANLGVDRLRFLAPVRPDDEITVTITVKSITRRPGAGRGEVRWDVEVVDQDDRTVTRYDMLTLMAGKPS